MVVINGLHTVIKSLRNRALKGGRTEGRREGRKEGRNEERKNGRKEAADYCTMKWSRISLNHYARIFYSILTALIHNMTNH